MKHRHGFSIFQQDCSNFSHVSHKKMQNKLAVMTDMINGGPTPKLEITIPAIFSPGVTLVELEPGVSGH